MTGHTNIPSMGNAAILDRPMVALLCSEKCPGKLILDTYDLAKLFRKQGVTVNGHDAQPRHRRIAPLFVTTQWSQRRG